MVDSNKFYDSVAENYGTQYDSSLIFNIDKPYPANLFRLKMLINFCKSIGAKNVLEIGCGEGTPLVEIAKNGFEVNGFDISSEMTRVAIKNFEVNNMDVSKIFEADISLKESYSNRVKVSSQDVVIAMGVMPHVLDDQVVIKNMAELTKPGGWLFIEFRNSLFSLFTFNRKTKEFILDELLSGIDAQILKEVSNSLESKLEMDYPKVRLKKSDGSPDYDSILSKFHNPLTIKDLFPKESFSNFELDWYHYHPAPPYLESKDPQLFRNESVKMETSTKDWRGMFLCSAFVVKVQKK